MQRVKTRLSYHTVHAHCDCLLVNIFDYYIHVYIYVRCLYHSIHIIYTGNTIQVTLPKTCFFFPSIFYQFCVPSQVKCHWGVPLFLGPGDIYAGAQVSKNMLGILMAQRTALYRKHNSMPGKIKIPKTWQYIDLN